MDLQNTFYLLGIIFMTFGVLILLGIVGILFLIMKGIHDISKNVNAKIDMVADRATATSSLAVDLGTAVAGSLIKKAKNVMQKKNEENITRLD